MEQVALKQSIAVPAQVKSSLMMKIANENKDAVITPMNSSGGSMLKLVAAASVILMIVFGALYYKTDSSRRDLLAEIEKVKTTNEEKNTIIAALEHERVYSKAEIAMFRNPEVKTVFLKSTNNKPEKSLAIVCWDTKTKQTLVAVEDLPKVPQGKQYQLWAIVDGKPANMGMIPLDSVESGFFAVKTVDQPQAFAITLENKGGSENPTLEEMYVMGGL